MITVTYYDPALNVRECICFKVDVNHAQNKVITEDGVLCPVVSLISLRYDAKP